MDAGDFRVQLAQVALNALDEAVQPPVSLAIERSGLQFQLRGTDAAGPATQGGEGRARARRCGPDAGPAPAAQAGASVAQKAPWTSPHAASTSAASSPTRASCGWCAPPTARSTCSPCCRQARAAATPPPRPWPSRGRHGRCSKRGAGALEHRGRGQAHRHPHAPAGRGRGAGRRGLRPAAGRPSRRGCGWPEGGQLAVRGKVVPATEPSMPRCRPASSRCGHCSRCWRSVHLNIAGGTVSTQGRLKVGVAKGKAPAPVRYDGAFELAGLALNEKDGKPSSPGRASPRRSSASASRRTCTSTNCASTAQGDPDPGGRPQLQRRACWCGRPHPRPARCR